LFIIIIINEKINVAFSSVHLHHDHIVTVFELSHIETNTLYNVF